MKPSEIREGSSYEDDREEIRTVESIREGSIHYTSSRDEAEYRRLPHVMSMRNFANWAARPAGKREDFSYRSARPSKGKIPSRQAA